MSLIFIFSFLLIPFQNKISQSVVETMPGILTTVGLFGTFWGIALGLGSFNVGDIEGSVPELLEGMKLAFWTSIYGMFTALILRVENFVAGLFRRKAPETGVSADDLYRVMREQKDILSELKNSIGADGDHSILTQVRLMRTDLREFRENMVDEFRSFAKNMADNNSQALIEALKEVIRDFNAKINEQFGDNFKELNRAVGALLEWQDNYRVQMETMISQFNLAAEGIISSQQAIAQIREDTASIPRVMKNLDALLHHLDHEVTQSAELLKGFTALRLQADEVFPTIKKGLESLTRDLSERVDSSMDHIESVFSQQQNSMTAMAKRVSEISIQTDSALRKGLDETQGLFKKALSEIETSMKKQFDSLDEQMQQELEKAIRLLGSKLASVAQKLVEDYSRLGQNIQRLLALSVSNKQEDDWPR
jgi:DNA anti-recombination protein RmuC